MKIDQTTDKMSIPENPADVKLASYNKIAAWIVRYALWLLAAATPLLLFPGRWTPVGLAIILAVWLARWVATGRLTVRTGLEPPIALLAAMTLMGVSVSADPSSSQAALWRTVAGLAWFYELANLVPTAVSLRRLSWLWMAVAAGLLLVVVAGTDWQNTRLAPLAIYDMLPKWGLHTQLGALGNPRGMGMALALVIPMLLAQALMGRDNVQRSVALLLAALMAPMLVLTQSLQGALGLVTAVVVLLFLWRPWTLLAAIPLAGAALWVAGQANWPALALTALDVKHVAGIGVVLRLDIWSRALAMLGDMPITGIGLDSFPLIQTQFYPGHLLGPETHAHNLLLQLMLDLSVAGLLGFLWLVVAFAAITGQALRREPEPWTRALLAGAAAGVAAMLGAGLIDSFWGFKLAVLFWLLLGTGVLAARAAAVRSGANASLAFAWRWQAVMGALIALVVAALAVRPGVWPANLGLVQAHRALAAARLDGAIAADPLTQARDGLAAAGQQLPHNAQIYDEIASLAAWLGEDAAALQALRQRVALDAADPLARYAPWESWRRQLTGEVSSDRADDMLLVYSQWMVRYPDRAEAYVRVALVWATLKGDPARAAAVLQEGLANAAQPAGLLRYSLAHLGPATTP